MFGLCESASSALMLCIIVSIVLIAVVAIWGYREAPFFDEESFSAALCGLIAFMFCGLVSAYIVISIQDDDVKKSLKDSLSRNYPGYVSLKEDYCGDVDYSFVCNGQKYTCDFDYDSNKTLTVYVDNSKTIDGIYIDGQKQDEDNSKSTSTDEKQSNSQTSESVSKDNSTGSASLSGYTDDNGDSNSKGLSGYTDDNSGSSLSDDDGGLVGNIQNKILEKYNGAIITGFDMIRYTGSFTYNNAQYSFSWKDDLLEVENAANANDVTYYKVTE